MIKWIRTSRFLHEWREVAEHALGEAAMLVKHAAWRVDRLAVYSFVRWQVCVALQREREQLLYKESERARVRGRECEERMLVKHAAWRVDRLVVYSFVRWQVHTNTHTNTHTHTHTHTQCV